MQAGRGILQFVFTKNILEKLMNWEVVERTFKEQNVSVVMLPPLILGLITSVPVKN